MKDMKEITDQTEYITEEEDTPAKKRRNVPSRVIDKGREIVRNLTSRQVSPASEWKYGEVSGEGDNVPLWWKHVQSPRLSKKDRKEEVKRLEEKNKEAEKYCSDLAEKNEKYRVRLENEAKRLEEERVLKQRHTDLLIVEREKELEKERLEQEKEIADIEDARLAKLEEEQKAQAELEEKAALDALEQRRALRRAQFEARREQALKIKQAEKEKLEAEKAALIERHRIEKEKREAQAAIKAQQLEYEKRIEDEKIAEEQERVRAELEARIEEENEKLRRIEAERAALEQAEAERQAEVAKRKEEERIERERIEAEKAEKALEDARTEELRQAAEKERIKREAKAFRIKDFEYQPYPKNYGDFNPLNAFELRELKFCDENGKTVVENVTLDVPKCGLTGVTGYDRAEINAIVSMMMRSYDTGKITSGALRAFGVNAIGVQRREYSSIVDAKVFVMPYDHVFLNAEGMSVNRYIKRCVGVEKYEDCCAILRRFNVYDKKFYSKKLSRMPYAELARVYIACTLTINRSVVIMCEPQRCLDAPTRLTLAELISEWRDKNADRAMVIFTSDDGIFPTSESGVKYYD